MEGNNYLKKISDSRSWMVIYTKSKWEKKAHQLLAMQGIESFCPLVKIKKKWADRMKMVETPLFNSYVFVNVNPLEQLRVLQTSGVVNFVNYCGKPALVPGSDIKRIKDLLLKYEDVESVSMRSIQPGDKVTFNDGVLFDIEGEVLEINGKSVLVVMKQLDCALVAKVRVSTKDVLLRKEAKYDKAFVN